MNRLVEPFTIREHFPDGTIGLERTSQIGPLEWLYRVDVAHGQFRLYGEATSSSLAHLWTMIPRIIVVPLPQQIIELRVTAAAPLKRRRKKPDLERAELERIKEGLRGRR